LLVKYKGNESIEQIVLTSDPEGSIEFIIFSDVKGTSLVQLFPRFHWLNCLHAPILAYSAQKLVMLAPFKQQDFVVGGTMVDPKLVDLFIWKVTGTL